MHSSALLPGSAAALRRHGAVFGGLFTRLATELDQQRFGRENRLSQNRAREGEEPDQRPAGFVQSSPPAGHLCMFPLYTYHLRRRNTYIEMALFGWRGPIRLVNHGDMVPVGL